MIIGRYGGPEKRRSPRFPKRLVATIEYEGKVHEIRTIDISEEGALIPKRIPPPVGTRVKVCLTIRGETSAFEGVVKRHTKCRFNGVETVGVGIEFSLPEYQEFVKVIF
ncbi:MAG TPA: PilZ domain-containing protein [Syntrophales bacterium]|nr:PilZ domain-containing protein [Syntrophales bacterium]